VGIKEFLNQYHEKGTRNIVFEEAVTRDVLRKVLELDKDLEIQKLKMQLLETQRNLELYVSEAMQRLMQNPNLPNYS